MNAARGEPGPSDTDRVLHRVASPDGRVVAVCQEIPVFDGPVFEVRLDRPDGTRLRELRQMGDGGGCDELRWSDDGRTLAVLTAHVAGINVIDVEWALSHPDVRDSHWFSRDISFSSESRLAYATGLKFAGPLELEFQLCDYSIAEAKRNGGHIKCSTPARPQRLRFSRPLVAGRPA